MRRPVFVQQSDPIHTNAPYDVTHRFETGQRRSLGLEGQSPVLGPLDDSSYSLRHVGDAALSAITMPWDVVVLGKWTDWTLNADLIRRHVRMNGYTLKGQIEHAEIYTLPEQAARQ
jgi:hypothetical protein